ncbi:hypothetical protein RRF57_007179 [Xylaria bambusicola]|uniref:HNH nuclease domain-containing protein n=1 Tax=Xylaria bambusicola TaxID=326684 RepID=A0AAN7UFS2_9PEZI
MVPLEGVIDFSAEAPLGIGQRNDAKRRFYRIVEHFRGDVAVDSSQYKPSLLVRYTYEYALSDESRDNFLRAFFRALALSLTGQDNDKDLDDLENLRSRFFGFASHLLDIFFLLSNYLSPFISSLGGRHAKASTKKDTATITRISLGCRASPGRRAGLGWDTRQVVPASRGLSHPRPPSLLIGLRLPVIDDGTLLREDLNPFDALEVAHILPHSLMKADAGCELNPSKQAALAVLNMFDSGIVHLINGSNINRPRNAITLTTFFHLLFSNFQVFFESITDQQPHTYRINSFHPRHLLREPALPIIRTLYLINDRSIDPPSPRLLAVHRAIAHILHFSAAGEYIDKLLRDMDEQGIQADGSTELDRLVRLRLGEWLDRPVY